MAKQELTTEAKRWLEKSKREMSQLHDLVTMLKSLTDNGFYTEILANNHTVLAGEGMAVGVVVGDLSKPPGQAGILKMKVGTDIQTILDQVGVLAGVKEPKATKDSEKG